jgi:hypothetical protein
MNTQDKDKDAQDGGWWSRARAVKEGKPKARNDYVSDLWANRGWNDDDYLDDELDTSLDQQRGPKSRSRSHYRRERDNERRNTPQAVGERTAQRAITAHGMVQSFIGAFADEFGYKVVYSLDSGAPAATIFEQKLVLVDPSPVFDKTISATTCGLVMTALACHEVSHILFDRHHGEAVREQVKVNRDLALRVSNILSDRRIEMRFSAKFPGYSDVFDPALEYVCRDFHGSQVTFDPADPGNIVVAAIRYAKWLDWSAPGMAAERDWWDDLANRAAQSDDVDWHVQHVIEGVKRLAKMKRTAPKTPPPVCPPPPVGPKQPPKPPTFDDETPHPFKP